MNGVDLFLQSYIPGYIRRSICDSNQLQVCSMRGGRCPFSLDQQGNWNDNSFKVQVCNYIFTPKIQHDSSRAAFTAN